jgi:hypothetical protein
MDWVNAQGVICHAGLGLVFLKIGFGNWKYSLGLLNKN